MRRFLLLALLLPAALPTAAQFDPDRFQVGLHLQTASYDGERSGYKGAGGLGNGFGLEASYSLDGLLPQFEAVVRFDRALYPGIIAGRPGYPSINKPESSESRTRLMAYARRTFHTPWALQPYASLGLATARGRINDETVSAWGPILGVGAQLPVASGRVTLFAEFLSHLTVPKDGIDLAEGDGGSADRLRALSAGVRYRIGKGALRNRLSVTSPRRLEVEEIAVFEAGVLPAAADPGYSVRWVFGDGSERTGKWVTHAFSEPGNYTVTVTATDGGEVLTRRVPVSVLVPTGPLAIEIVPPESVVAGQPVTLQSRSTGGKRGARRTVSWTLADGTVLEGDRVRHIFRESGDYPVRATVSDGVDSVATTLAVTVVEPPPPPPVTLSLSAPETGEVGREIRFAATVGGGAEGARRTVTWNFGDGNSADGTRVRHTYERDGRYSVEVIVSDGLTEAREVSAIEIAPAPTVAAPPVVEQERAAPEPVRARIRRLSDDVPGEGMVGQPVTFAVAVEIEGPPTTPEVEWVFGDGSTAVGERVEHTFATAGRFDWRATVSVDGRSQTRRGRIRIAPIPEPEVAPPPPPMTQPERAVESRAETPPPVVPPARQETPSGGTIDILEVAQAPIRPIAGQEISFQPVVRGTGYTCAWEFGDGASGTGCEARHTYALPGRYTFRLRVNGPGSSASFTKEVNVETNRCLALENLHTVSFFSNSSELIPDMRNLLRENVDLLIGCPGQSIRIVASATPDEQDAERLANQRALSVYQYYRLMGVPSNRFAAEFDIVVERVANLEDWQQRYAQTTLR